MAQTAASSQPVIARVDASKTGPAISPYLYGQFVEHAGGLVYNTLWSEMLDDRKFFYPVGPAPASAPETARRGGGFFGRGVGPGRWNPIGPDGAVVMDARNPFVGDHSPEIKLAGSEPCGIRQTGLHFIQGHAYNGRVQLSGDPGAKVSVGIVYDADNGNARQTVSLGKLSAGYRKFTFSFKAEKSGDAQLQIAGTGTGSFRVGAVSLMDADNLDGFRPDAVAALKSLRFRRLSLAWRQLRFRV